MDKKKIIIILILLLTVFTSSWGLFQKGYFTIHDQEHVVRLYEYDQALRSGQIPPRWGANLGYGYGYPIFVFYPPLIYIVSEFFHLFGFSLIISIKLMLISGAILSAVFMYLFARHFLGRMGGVLASIAFLLAPYRAVNLYVRGAFAEYFAYSFLPLVFLCFYKLIKKPGINKLILASISLSLIILSHSLVTIPFIPFLLIYILYLLILNKGQTIKRALYAFLSVILSFLLTAFFWLPSFLEKKYTMVDKMLTTDLANYEQHFVYLRQFIKSTWGYGGSIYGLDDNISFSLGIVYLLSVFVSLFFLLRKRFLKKGMPLFMLFLFLSSVFMASFHSYFIWSLFKNFLAYLQFPWRYLLFAAFAASFLFAFVLLKIMTVNKKIALFLLTLSLFFLIWPSFTLYHFDHRLPNIDDSYFINDEMMKWVISKKSDEYIPREVNENIKTDYPLQIANKSKITKEMISKERYQLIQGNATVEILYSKPGRELFKIQSKTGGIIQINTFDFPGWQAYLNGGKVSHSSNNDLKLITLVFPSGDSRIELRFEKTFIIMFSDIISLVALVSIVVYFFRRLIYQKLICQK